MQLGELPGKLWGHSGKFVLVDIFLVLGSVVSNLMSSVFRLVDSRFLAGWQLGGRFDILSVGVVRTPSVCRLLTPFTGSCLFLCVCWYSSDVRIVVGKCDRNLGNLFCLYSYLFFAFWCTEMHLVLHENASACIIVPCCSGMHALARTHYPFFAMTAFEN